MEIKYNIPLAKYTSYKVGGDAKIYFKPQNTLELVDFLKNLPITEDLLWLGLGSNLLIRDGGFDGAVIHTLNTFNNITILQSNEQGILVKLGVGVTCAKLAKFCIQHNLAEGIWFAGIPGTLGGALSMNAGAFGGETWKHVRSVEVVNRLGETYHKLPKDYQIGYRSVKSINSSLDPTCTEWFISANVYFAYNASSSEHNLLQSKVDDLLQIRKLTQPIGTLNCGSVFKNPSNNWAGKLIENANLKGKRSGDAVVSTKHANFIINLGTATAKDIEGLINCIQTEIFTKHKIF